MSKQRKSAYGAPPEQREVVITMDRRLAAGAALVTCLGVAMAGGLWWGQRGPTAAAPGSPRGAGEPDATQIAAEMLELGMDPSKAVSIRPAATLAPGEANPFAPATPALPAQQPPATTLPGIAEPTFEAPVPGGVEVDLPERQDGPMLPAEVLAEMADPNLSEDLVPIRAETVAAPVAGPRIAISDLNAQYTYNFGKIPISKVAEKEFHASNAGDEDLIISRIYASCGCTATVFGGIKIKADGFLPQPVTLKPGESRPFVVQFDPRAEGRPVTQAKYIQIYSNDPTRFLYADDEPLSHEIRFRIVVQPE
jgi:hypothetical protein